MRAKKKSRFIIFILRKKNNRCSSVAKSTRTRSTRCPCGLAIWSKISNTVQYTHWNGEVLAVEDGRKVDAKAVTSKFFER
jgi:hypothetical protein